MTQIDTVWEGTNQELHIISSNNKFEVRSADNPGISRSMNFTSQEYPELGKNITVFQKGTDLEFIPNICVDATGFIYDGIRVNNQIWLSTGLRTSRFNDGTYITRGYTLDSSAPKQYYYGGGSDTPLTHNDSYGKLYNYLVVSERNDHNGVAPVGWDVATKDDWDTLMTYLASNTAFGSPAKAIASKDGWTTSSTSGVVGNLPSLNNITGMNIYPWGTKTGQNGRSYFTQRSCIWVADNNKAIYLAHASSNQINTDSDATSNMNGRLIFCVKTLSSVSLLMGGFNNPSQPQEPENPESEEETNEGTGDAGYKMDTGDKSDEIKSDEVSNIEVENIEKNQ